MYILCVVYLIIDFTRLKRNLRSVNIIQCYNNDFNSFVVSSGSFVTMYVSVVVLLALVDKIKDIFDYAIDRRGMWPSTGGNTAKQHIYMILHHGCRYM